MKNLIIIIFLLNSFLFSLSAQSIKVAGKVTDEKGEVLSGAFIIVKNSNKGTYTNSKGEYEIDIEKGQMLVCSFLGFNSQEVSVSSNTINFCLNENNQSLNEVVVIGYQSVNRRDVTGAIVSIGKDHIGKKMSTSVLEALQGAAAGVNITSSSGQPGASASIRIRGLSTFGDGVEPLYIVDGIQTGDINTINPNDIASIDILKDAASASIYGARSANGVVIITTKQGIPQKPSINISYAHSMGKLTHTMEQMTPQDQLNFYKKAQAYLFSQENNNFLSPNVIHRFDPLINDSLNYMQSANNNYQKDLFKISRRDVLNVDFSGGSPIFKYYLASGIINETGIISNTSLTRLNTRINTDFSLSKKLLIRSRMYLSAQNKKGVDEFSYLNSMLNRQSNVPYIYPDGDLLGFINNVGRNPYSFSMVINKNQVYQGYFSESLDYSFNRNLKLTTSLNADMTVDRTQQMTPSFIIDPDQKSNWGLSISNIYTNWLWNAVLNYTKVYREKHAFTALLGYEMSSNRFEQDQFVGEDSPSDYLYTMNAFASNFNLDYTYTDVNESRMISTFGRASYSYKSKYIINTNLRIDRSSRFSKDNSIGVFPSISCAWRISEEDFMKWAKEKDIWSDAKIRASYGTTGNDRIGYYDAYATYSTSTPYDGLSTLLPSSIESNGLSWERTRQFNIGTDIYLLPTGDITLTFDYYNKKTDRLLAWIDLPKELGFSGIRRNIGAVQNSGYEIALSALLINKQKFSVKCDGNIAFNQNKILTLANHTPVYLSVSAVSGNSYILTEGGRIGDFYGFEYLGVFQYDESNAFDANWNQLTPVMQKNATGSATLLGYKLNGIDYIGTVYKKKLPDGTPFRGGDINWALEDGNTTGIVDYNKSRKIIGNALPICFGGLTTNVNYGKFNLFIAFNYSIGGQIYNFAKQYSDFGYATTGFTTTKDFMNNSWTKQGDLTKYPRIYSYDYWQNNRMLNSMYLEDASFVRLSNVKITYTISDKSKSYSLYGYVNNALLWTAYSGFDPEFTSGSMTPNMDTNVYPRKRELGVGVEINL